MAKRTGSRRTGTLREDRPSHPDYGSLALTRLLLISPSLDLLFSALRYLSTPRPSVANAIEHVLLAFHCCQDASSNEWLGSFKFGGGLGSVASFRAPTHLKKRIRGYLSTISEPATPSAGRTGCNLAVVPALRGCQHKTDLRLYSLDLLKSAESLGARPRSGTIHTQNMFVQSGIGSESCHRHSN